MAEYGIGVEFDVPWDRTNVPPAAWTRTLWTNGAVGMSRPVIVFPVSVPTVGTALPLSSTFRTSPGWPPVSTVSRAAISSVRWYWSWTLTVSAPAPVSISVWPETVWTLIVSSPAPEVMVVEPVSVDWTVKVLLPDPRETLTASRPL